MAVAARPHHRNAPTRGSTARFKLARAKDQAPHKAAAKPAAPAALTCPNAKWA